MAKRTTAAAHEIALAIQQNADDYCAGRRTFDAFDTVAKSLWDLALRHGIEHDVTRIVRRSS